MVGKTLGHYKVLRKLGQGGMGEVYVAQDIKLNREVALKVLPTDVAADSERRARFEREARAIAALNHPNIVTIFSVEEARGVHFLTMELVDGPTLTELIPDKGLTLPKLFDLVLPLTDAVATAHETGITHRDLKPDNIMVDSAGRLKVLDFGLAKLHEDPASGAAAGDTQMPTASVTQEGRILGTVAYMSPEQAEGKTVDPRSDVFSLGIILYEMSTGRRPFKGDTAISTISSILREQPQSITELKRNLPRHLGRITKRALAKDPRRRYQSAIELRNELEELKGEIDSGELEIGAPTSGVAAPRSRWGLWLGLVAVILAGAALAVLLMRSPSGTGAAPGAATGVQELTPVPLTSYPGDERDPSFSPDGNQIVFSWAPEGGEHDLYVKLIGPGDPIRLTDTPESERMAHWSPDGRWIAVPRVRDGQGQVVVLPALGGPERILASDRSSGYIAWAPDSQGVVYAGGSPHGLHLAPLSGGGSRMIVSSTTDRAVAVGIPSPDGKWLYLETREVASYVKAVLPLEAGLQPAGEPRTVIPEEWWTFSPAWSADSREVYFIRGFGDANAGADTAMYRVGVEGGEPRRVSFAGDNPWFLDASRQGNRLAYTRLLRDINIYEAEIGADGEVGPGRAVALSSRREESADPAPDGKRLVFASNRSGPMEIWISDRQGGGLTQITTSSAENETNSPRWSPDGSWIAYHAEVKGSSQIFVVSAAGGAPLQLTHEPGRDQLPAWSADSRSIYFASNRGGSTGIWKVPATGGDAVPVVGDSRAEKTESPDGRWLYFRRGATLLRVPTGGGKEEQVVSDVGERGGFLGGPMCAAVTAKGIYYLGRAEEGKPGSPIRFVAHSGGPPKTVGRIAKRVREGLTASRDGRYLYWSQYDVESADLRLVEGFH